MIWEKVKHLTKLCPVYLEVMDEQESNIPDDYVLIQENSFDESFSEGDGKSLLRKKSFNIRIHCRTRSKIPELITAYRSALHSHNLSFTQFGPIYSPSDRFTSINFSGNYIYGN